MGICTSTAIYHSKTILPASYLLNRDQKQQAPCEIRELYKGKMPHRMEELYKTVLSNPFALIYINLSLSFLGASGSVHLAKLLSSCPNLRDLKLWKCRIGVKGAQILSEPLKALLHLEVLGIEENDLGIEGAEQIMHSLTSLENLRELYCHSNDLQYQGMKYLCDGLSGLQHLTVLLMDNNDITSSGLKYLLETVQLEKLESLGLSHDRITDCGARALTQSAGKLKYLRLLKIYGNLVNVRQREKLQYTFPTANIF